MCWCGFSLLFPLEQVSQLHKYQIHASTNPDCNLCMLYKNIQIMTKFSSTQILGPLQCPVIAFCWSFPPLLHLFSLCYFWTLVFLQSVGLIYIFMFDKLQWTFVFHSTFYCLLKITYVFASLVFCGSVFQCVFITYSDLLRKCLSSFQVTLYNSVS